MSAEERIYKQLENISSTIIKALEALEREVAEYIQVTDSRLLKLEEKINRLGALADVSSRGLVKTVENSIDKGEVSALSHITTPTSSPTPQTPTPPPVTQIESPKEQPPQPSVVTPVEAPDFTKIPAVPIPPTFKATLEEKPVKEEITIPQPKSSESSLSESSVAEKLEEKEKKETDKDKDDLMSALKMIDSL
ncbi:MAG: hypothetical protein ACTSQK_01205 [Candidatus Heimdallarchaeota archaeon]